MHTFIRIVYVCKVQKIIAMQGKLISLIENVSDMFSSSV